jgi:hypothetical protein
LQALSSEHESHDKHKSLSSDLFSVLKAAPCSSGFAAPHTGQYFGYFLGSTKIFENSLLQWLHL